MLQSNNDLPARARPRINHSALVAVDRLAIRFVKPPQKKKKKKKKKSCVALGLRIVRLMGIRVDHSEQIGIPPAPARPPLDSPNGTRAALLVGQLDHVQRRRQQQQQSALRVHHATRSLVVRLFTPPRSPRLRGRHRFHRPMRRPRKVRGDFFLPRCSNEEMGEKKVTGTKKTKRVRLIAA